jgi:Cu+-exporting ATPase
VTAGTHDTHGAPPLAVATVDLAVEGMTCASCVARVEKRLNQVPGVTATVNLPLESAHIELTVGDDGEPADDDALLAAVRRAGYDARVTARRDVTTSATGVRTSAPHMDHAGMDHAGMNPL